MENGLEEGLGQRRQSTNIFIEIEDHYSNIIIRKCALDANDVRAAMLWLLPGVPDGDATIRASYTFSNINSYDNIEAKSIGGGGMATEISHK